MIRYSLIYSLCVFHGLPVNGFSAVSLAQSTPSHPASSFSSSVVKMVVDAAAAGEMLAEDHSDHLYNPNKRNDHYGKGSSSDLNVAQYLIDLHDAKATLNFCGGMMFQLVLSDRLKDYLVEVADETITQKKNLQQLEIFSASQARMFQIPDYEKSANVDNIKTFHGREIRKVTDAAGDMGMVLQLSLADLNGDGENDPEGWTVEEIVDYDGWGSDIGRTWRTGERLEKEGFQTYREQFGKDAFGLHHRFYLHFDRGNQMWLSAEDGCEGTPAAPAKKWGWLDAFKN